MALWLPDSIRRAYRRHVIMALAFLEGLLLIIGLIPSMWIGVPMSVVYAWVLLPLVYGDLVATAIAEGGE